MNFLTIIKTVVSLFPLIIQAINAIEAAFPQSGKGAQKLDLLKQVLAGSAEVSEDLDKGQFDQVWPAIAKTVGAVVSLGKAL